MANEASNDIWAHMGYVPPRGLCNYKQSYISPSCPCLRFMIHPLKMSSSFSCDGCGHHASFHNMENKSDEEIIQRWQAEEQLQKDMSESSSPPRKRRRADALGSVKQRSLLEHSVPSRLLDVTEAISTQTGNVEAATRPMLEWVNMDEEPLQETSSNRARATARKKTGTRTRGKAKVTLPEDSR